MAEQTQADQFAASLADASDTTAYRQEKILDTISVYDSLSEFIGEEGFQIVEEAFSKPEDTANYSADLDIAVNRFRSTTPQKSEIRLVKFENNIIPYLIRRTEIVPGRLMRTEFYLRPEATLQNSDEESSMLCSMYLITDLSTGKIANLIDVNRPGAAVFPTVGAKYKSEVDRYGKRRMYVSESYIDPESDLAKHSELDQIPLENVTNFVYLHESGHTNQRELNSLYAHESPKLRPSLRDRLNQFLDVIIFNNNKKVTREQRIVDIREERNASAFALAVIRKYRSLGVDLCPNVSNTDLINLVNSCLASRPRDRRVKQDYTKMAR